MAQSSKTSGKPAEIHRPQDIGLTGEDRKRSALRDDRSGTYDLVTEAGRIDMPPDHKREAGEADTASLPEGLKRERKGPVGPKTGRAAGNR